MFQTRDPTHQLHPELLDNEKMTAMSLNDYRKERDCEEAGVDIGHEERFGVSIIGEDELVSWSCQLSRASDSVMTTTYACEET